MYVEVKRPYLKLEWKLQEDQNIHVNIGLFGRSNILHGDNLWAVRILFCDGKLGIWFLAPCKVPAAITC